MTPRYTKQHFLFVNTSLLSTPESAKSFLTCWSASVKTFSSSCSPNAAMAFWMIATQREFCKYWAPAQNIFAPTGEAAITRFSCCSTSSQFVSHAKQASTS